MKNKVSIWFGKFSSNESFQSYIEKTYDLDGNSHSKFMEEFDIQFYDEDFQDAFLQTESDFYTELFDLSYADSFVQKIDKSIADSYNAVICLYDFDYNNKNKDISKLKMDYIGSFDYVKKSWRD